MLHIVHLEDDGPLQEVLQISLRAANPNLTLKQFIDSDEMFTYTLSNIEDIDLFILDVRVFGSMNGIEVAKKIRQLNTNVPIIITSAFQKPSSDLLLSLNCQWYAKPWHIVDITRDMLNVAQAATRRKNNLQALSSELELIMPGLARRLLDKRQIVVFSITEASHLHIDGFFDHLYKVQLGWPYGQPYLGLYDFSLNLNLTLTPEFRKRSLEIITLRPDLVRRHAFALPSFTTVRPLWGFIRSEWTKVNEQQEVAIFQDGKSALTWLRSRL